MGCSLVVHYWADLQSVHGLRCYGNITRTRNVSEYMLVLALCLVKYVVSNVDLAVHLYKCLPVGRGYQYAGVLVPDWPEQVPVPRRRDAVDR